MDAEYFSKLLVTIYQTTSGHIPECSNMFLIKYLSGNLSRRFNTVLQKLTIRQNLKHFNPFHNLKISFHNIHFNPLSFHILPDPTGGYLQEAYRPYFHILVYHFVSIIGPNVRSIVIYVNLNNLNCGLT
jgi:hypothetical protein